MEQEQFARWAVQLRLRLVKVGRDFFGNAAEVPVPAAEAAPLVAAAESRETTAPTAAETTAQPATLTPRGYRDRVRRTALAIAAEAGHDLAFHDWQ